MSKIITLAVAGGAYVLGAKAGTQRYEQISEQAGRVLRHPRVQQQASRARGLVTKKADAMVQEDQVAGPVDDFSATPASTSETATSAGTTEAASR